MSNASSNSLNKLTVAIHRLETAIAAADAQRRPPAKVPESLKDISEALCADGEMVDLDGIIHAMDRLTAQTNVRAKHLEMVIKLISKETK